MTQQFEERAWTAARTLSIDIDRVETTNEPRLAGNAVVPIADLEKVARRVEALETALANAERTARHTSAMLESGR
ncbi:hypothetical protein ACFV9C_42215 [Kribbella sp. NPDC059898]|uniref:hypothetical protein n=1 Tax=Kribbella sp. NPDC059898 TaxID=3346995 RepID=UPI00365FB882